MWLHTKANFSRNMPRFHSEPSTTHCEYKQGIWKTTSQTSLLRVRETSQWEKYLLHKHEHLSAKHIKPSMLRCSYNPRAATVRWETETGEPPEACGSASLTIMSKKTKCLLQRRWKGERTLTYTHTGMLAALAHAHTHTHTGIIHTCTGTCTHTHTHMHVHACTYILFIN